MDPALAAALHAAAPALPDALCVAIAARARRMQVADGARLFGPGDAAQGFLMPLRGAVRVEHVGASGRAVTLYRVGPGESCVMTTACILSGGVYQGWGYAEGALEALALPPAAFAALLDADAAFRALVLGAVSSRIVALVEVIDELLLHRVDLRLAAWLAARAPAAAATHQEIATDLGTAREVVSRILKDFERRGWLTLGRGAIEVSDPAALAAFAVDRAQ